MAYGILAVCAVLMTLGAGKERGPAFASGLVILCGWAAFVATWTDYAPDLWLASIGVNMHYIDVWAMTDMVMFGLILCIGQERWWSLSLCGLLFMQVLLHCLHQFAGWGYGSYSIALDMLFLAQVAVLFTLGGGRACEYLMSRFHDHARNAVRPHPSTPQE